MIFGINIIQKICVQTAFGNTQKFVPLLQIVSEKYFPDLLKEKTIEKILTKTKRIICF